MCTFIRILVAMLFLSWTRLAIGEEVSVETVLSGLSQPTSVAIRPGGTAERYEVFVADSGAHRIIKISSNEPSRSTEVITRFPDASTAGKRLPKGNPFELLFLDEKHLVAGMAGFPPELRLYELTEADNALNADGAKQKVLPELSGEDSTEAFGSCVGLVRTRSNDYVADLLLAAFDRSYAVSGLWKVPVRANMLGELKPLESKPLGLVSQPTALAVSEEGYVLAVDASSRSAKKRLMFLSPTDDRVVLVFESDLSQISGLAYSPKSGNLYALATVYAKDEEGLFRLDDARESGGRKIATSKLADIKRAGALAFGPDGALYVTTLGEDTEENSGKLLVVTGGL
jgi:hypothetical protein